MVKKRIKVLISPEGEVTVEAIGYKGKACEEATRGIEKMLGSVTEKKFKPERYAAGSSVAQKVGGKS